MVKSAGDVGIMVVDDCSTSLHVISFMLKKLNYQVATAKSGADALSALRAESIKVDLVISDVHMPSMNGLQLMDRVLMQFQLPFILISGDQKNGIVHQGLKKGAYKFLAKPVKLSDLENLKRFASRPKTKASGTGNISRHLPPPTNPTDQRPNSNRTLLIRSPLTSQQHPDQQVCGPQLTLPDWLMTGDEKLSTRSKRKFPADYKGDSQMIDDKTNKATVKKKAKVVWTDALHGRFLEALHFLGSDNAVPRKIMEYMQVPGLTRKKIASHLQKYRIYLKRLADPKFVAKTQSKMRPRNPMNNFPVVGFSHSSASSTNTLPSLRPQHQSSSHNFNNFGTPDYFRDPVVSILAPPSFTLTAPASAQPAVNSLSTILRNPHQQTWSLLPHNHQLTNPGNNTSANYITATATATTVTANANLTRLGENVPRICTPGSRIQRRDKSGLLELLEQQPNYNIGGDGYRAQNTNNRVLSRFHENNLREYPAGLQLIGSNQELNSGVGDGGFRIASSGGDFPTNNMTTTMRTAAVPRYGNVNNNVGGYGRQLGQNTESLYIPDMDRHYNQIDFGSGGYGDISAAILDVNFVGQQAVNDGVPQTLTQTHDGFQSLQPQGLAADGSASGINILDQSRLDRDNHMMSTSQYDQTNRVGGDTFICLSGIPVEDYFDEYMNFLANDDDLLHKEYDERTFEAAYQ